MLDRPTAAQKLKRSEAEYFQGPTNPHPRCPPTCLLQHGPRRRRRRPARARRCARRPRRHALVRLRGGRRAQRPVLGLRRVFGALHAERGVRVPCGRGRRPWHRRHRGAVRGVEQARQPRDGQRVCMVARQAGGRGRSDGGVVWGVAATAHAGWRRGWSTGPRQRALRLRRLRAGHSGTVRTHCCVPASAWSCERTTGTAAAVVSCAGVACVLQ